MTYVYTNPHNAIIRFKSKYNTLIKFMITLIIIAIIIVKYVGLAHFNHNKQAGKLLHVFHSGQSCMCACDIQYMVCHA